MLVWEQYVGSVIVCEVESRGCDAVCACARQGLCVNDVTCSESFSTSTPQCSAAGHRVKTLNMEASVEQA